MRNTMRKCYGCDKLFYDKEIAHITRDGRKKHYYCPECLEVIKNVWSTYGSIRTDHDVCQCVNNSR